MNNAESDRIALASDTKTENISVLWVRVRIVIGISQYDAKIFERAISDDNLFGIDGVYIKEIHTTLDFEYISDQTHYTFNIHSGEWNVSLIRKALSLVDRRIFSFRELQQIRVAYELYEHRDTKGLVAYPGVILQTLKMCGRIVSPKKLVHWLKHCQGEFEEEGRLQLYEFLDLLLWCVVYEKYDPKQTPSIEGQDGDLFLLLDFRSVLRHHDERLRRKLDAQYRADHWDFGEPAYTGNCDVTSLRDLPVLISTCDDEVKESKEEYKELQTALNKSDLRVKRARNATVHSKRPSVVDLTHLLNKHETAKSGGWGRKEDAREKLKKYLTKSCCRRKDRPKPLRQTHPSVVSPVTITPSSSCVTPADLQATAEKMAELKFNMATVGTRYKRKKERELAELLIGSVKRSFATPAQEDETTIKRLIVDNFMNPVFQRTKKAKSAPTTRSMTSCQVSRRHDV